MDNVAPLPIPKARVEAIVKEIAGDSARVIFPRELEEETWNSRVTYLQVQKCLRVGKIVAQPALDDLRNWTCQLDCSASGSRVRTTVALVDYDGEQYLVVKEVFVY